LDVSLQLKIPSRQSKYTKIAADADSDEAKMRGFRNTMAAWLLGTGVMCAGGPGFAELLKGADRETFVASATKACVATYGNGQAAKMAKPLFEQYCACVANGMADRIPKADLLEESETPDMSKKNEKILDEQVHPVQCGNNGAATIKKSDLRRMANRREGWTIPSSLISSVG
jgi:hypothetical protein